MAFRLPASLNNTQLDSIAFLNGLNEDDSLATIDFFNWNQDIPASYGPASTPDGIAHKWQAGAAGTQAVAGTSGGTVAVYFDPGSNWSAAEENAFISGLTLWSDYANIKFTVVTNAADAQFTFYRYSTSTPPSGGLSDGAYTSTSYNFSYTTSGLTLGSISSGGYMSIDTKEYGFQDLDSFSLEGGYGLTTVVHEEGHLLGLGHSGPYDGNVDPATQQFDAYDTRLYSIMSYIQPSNTSAAYYNSYPVTGTNWGTTSDGGVRTPTTPQMLDILAVQQLYGVSTSTTFAGGQIFGFNCNITDASKPFFDFTVDTAPVITIWDSGTDNTLDLSGYATPSTVNLNPGDFSSVDGMVNNIGIAYSTAIDTAIGGSGNDTFIVNADPDTIEGGGGINTVVFLSPYDDYTIAPTVGGETVKDILTGVTDTLAQIQYAEFSNDTVPVCYLHGTRILTIRGEVPIEDLVIGDHLVTFTGESRALQWIGRRSYSRRFAAANALVWPIQISANALADGVPARDLFLSPSHALYLDGVLIPAAALVNGTTIRPCTEVSEIEYLHLELDRHDVIRAEGAWSETYLDCGNRQMFHNASGFFDRFQWPAPPEPIEYAQRWESGDAVEAVRARLNRHATAPANAAYRIRLDQPGLTRVVCPPDVTDIHLISPIGYASGDFRPLGALLIGLRLNGQPLPLTHPALARGFHRLEQHGDATVRWTNGAAVLAVGACSTVRAPRHRAEQTLEITVATLMQSAA